MFPENYGEVNVRTWSRPTLITAGIAAVSVVASVSALIVALSDLSARSGGTPPEWLSAWSTFGGSVATGVGALATGFAAWQAVLVYRRQEQEKRRAQSSKVTLTMTPDQYTPGGNLLLAEAINSSDQMIHEVVLVAETSNGQKSSERSVLKPTGAPLRISTKKADTYSATLTFRDANGLQWRRHSNGELVEVRNAGAEHN